jgi:hypothetical protein
MTQGKAGATADNAAATRSPFMPQRPAGRTR